MSIFLSLPRVLRVDTHGASLMLGGILLGALWVSPPLYAAQYTSPDHSKAVQAASSALHYVEILAKVQRYQAHVPVWEAQQKIAHAAVRQSQLWSNPNVTVQQTGFQSGDDQELEFGISQKLDLFGERRAATRLAQIQVQQVNHRQILFDAQLKLIVKAAYAEVVVAEQQHAILLKQLSSSQKILDAARLRYKAGSIAQVDFNRSLMNHVENQRAFQESELGLNLAKQKMAALWGESITNYQVADDTAAIWPATSTSFDAKPNLYTRAMQLQAEQQRLEIDYLKAQRRPNPTVTLGVVQSKQAGMSGRDNQIRAAVEIPLNLIDRQQYALQGYAAKQQLLDQQQRFYAQQNFNQLKRLQTELTGLNTQYQLMQKQQIPLSVEVLDKMLLGFQAGKFSITDVQQAALQLHEQQLKKNQLLKQAWQSTLQLEARTLGISPDTIMSADALEQLQYTLWQDTQSLNTGNGAN